MQVVLLVALLTITFRKHQDVTTLQDRREELLELHLPRQELRKKKITVQPQESLFWKGSQSRLCHRIRQEQEEGTELVISFTGPCDMIHREQRHGNYVLGLYGMQLAAMAYRANFEFQCARSNQTTDNLFWWLQTNQTTRTSLSQTVYDPPLPIPDQACRGMGKAPLHYTSERIRQDLRNMAVKIFGTRDETIEGLYHDLETPLFPGEPLDEVAIHFRCGDVLSNLGKGDTNYGLIQFRSYKDRILPQVLSIGIVTIPFDPNHLRREDAAFGRSCQRLVQELVSYLSASFPQANVTIRNDPDETIPMIYSRLIMAKQMFCVRSTFCIFPAIASLGTSYVQEGGVAYFVSPMADAYKNIELMNDGKHLMSWEIDKRGLESTIEWLKS